ncbi:hypothetical protein HanRHA438_Chr10g0477941 [Helianthus annuus]|nr:hypothetical protein HanRHA438_Chr10g0477941 [Helianthus annuus]
MKSIADDLALAQKPVDEDDLIVHIIAHLGDDYKPVTAAVKMRDTSISFSDLFEKLVDHERSLQEAQPATPLLTTVNNTQRRSTYSRNPSDARGSYEARNSRPNNYGPRSSRPQNANTSNFRTNRNNLFVTFVTSQDMIQKIAGNLHASSRTITYQHQLHLPTTQLSTTPWRTHLCLTMEHPIMRVLTHPVYTPSPSMADPMKSC